MPDPTNSFNSPHHLAIVHPHGQHLHMVRWTALMMDAQALQRDGIEYVHKESMGKQPVMHNVPKARENRSERPGVIEHPGPSPVSCAKESQRRARRAHVPSARSSRDGLTRCARHAGARNRSEGEGCRSGPPRPKNHRNSTRFRATLLPDGRGCGGARPPVAMSQRTDPGSRPGGLARVSPGGHAQGSVVPVLGGYVACRWRGSVAVDCR